jgi:hypothetical protein
MVKCGVLFEVGTEVLNVIQSIFGFKRLKEEYIRLDSMNELRIKPETLYTNTLRHTAQLSRILIQKSPIKAKLCNAFTNTVQSLYF